MGKHASTHGLDRTQRVAWELFTAYVVDHHKGVYKALKRALLCLVLAALVAGGLLAQADNGTILLSQAKNKNYNYARALQRYGHAEDAARHTYELVESDYQDGRKQGVLPGMTGSHEKDLKKYQANLRSIREEAARNGYTIQQSRWETAWSRK